MATDPNNSGINGNPTDPNGDNGNNPTTKGEETTVTMTQAKLDELINSKFGKGAEKAKAELLQELGVSDVDSLKGIIQLQKDAEEANKTELQKMQEQLEAMKSEKEAIEKKAQEANLTSEIAKLAALHGVQDIEVFEVLYKNASKGEGFDGTSFLESLKEGKPYLFGVPTKPRVDNSSNNRQDPLDFATRVKQAKTKRELDALYAELNQ